MPELYYLKENALTDEECEQIATYIKNNSQDDHRDYYLHAPFLVQDFYKEATPELSILKKAIRTCNDVFTSNYSFNYNRFELKRFFGNIMHPGAVNEPHDDDGDIYPGKKDVEEHYSAILMLTDNYEGGELFFEHHDVEVKLKRGDLIMFRGNAENLHGVREVLSGERVNVIIFFRNYQIEGPINGDQWGKFLSSYGASE